jgi:hypothetical protein
MTKPSAEKPSVREAWDSFVRDVMPPDAGPEQRKEMRGAFYGGYHACLQMMVSMPDRIRSDEEGMDEVESLLHELNAFVQLAKKDMD